MNMVPYDYQRFIKTMKHAVSMGAISQARIDDAVRRILRAKLQLGLFEHPYGEPALAASVGSSEHRALARQAVRESMVLLKNDGALPIAKDTAIIFVSGANADSVGAQLGGWSLSWQGSATAYATDATSILDGIKAAVSPETKVVYEQWGKFDGTADIGIVVIGEAPYAEGVGDSPDLGLSPQDIQSLTNTRAHVRKLIVVLVSGRPLVITRQFQLADAWVAAWLPGTEGEGVADVLFGDAAPTGKLPQSWPATALQVGVHPGDPAYRPLFPYGFGLTYRQAGRPASG
jgi:beta-glucosidase